MAHTMTAGAAYRTFRPERPKYSPAQIVDCLLHEAALAMAELDAETAWKLMDAARRIGDQEGDA